MFHNTWAGVMDADELRKTMKCLDAMSERVDKVIGHERPEKPLRPDMSYPRRAKPRVGPAPVTRKLQATPAHSEPIASGELTGNEMRLSNGYSPRPQQHDDCDPDGMWATFETEFDEMVQTMR